MCRTGLLVLTSSQGQLAPRLRQLLAGAARRVSWRLYVQLLPGQPSLSGAAVQPAFTPLTYGQLIGQLYAECSSTCPQLDVRVLLTHLKRRSLTASTAAPVDLLLLEQPCGDDQLREFTRQHVTNRAAGGLKTVTLQPQEPLLPEQTEHCSGLNEQTQRWTNPLTEPDNALTADRVYGKVALGGTFDGIHNGHKLLLTAALLRCSTELTVGVTDGPMNRDKTLPELMAPCLERVQLVADLVSDLDASVRARVLPITDPYGPTQEEGDLQLLVVSAETAAGAELINRRRRERRLPPMDVYTVPLLADPARQQPSEEAKLSSSSLRMRRLGTLRRPRLGVRRRPDGPYVIGLTGSLASGKSSIGRRLEALGARLIDCDRLGHQVYEPGSAGYERVVAEFGREVVDAEGRIDRRRLGALVFSDPALLRRLTDCVWPEIAALVERQLAQLGRQDVAVLDAAVLLEAGWDSACDEVWVTVVPREEAIRRAVRRDGISEQQAASRLDNQLSNERRVQAASVVFSTLWEPEYTQAQVERAWKQLQQDLGQPN